MIHAVDLFCGAGGTSSGLAKACKALDLDVDLLAINHWKTAVNSHTENHPWARHLCVPVESVNPRDEMPGGRVDILLASPECTHHSTARGGKPVNDQLRASAWHIMRWVHELDVRNVLIENVPEFQSWGPTSKRGGKPLKSKKGQYFRAFVQALEASGYIVEHRVLNAADHGDATSRRRLFILARKGKVAPRWPTPTHSKGGSAPGTARWRSAREIIDWSLRGESIFDRQARGLRPLSEKTVERIFKGLERHGGEALQPFLVILRGTGTAKAIGDPVPALTAGGQHVGLAEPFVLSMASGGAPRPVSEPMPTIVGKGGGFVAEAVILPPDGPFNNGTTNHAKPVEDPLPTIRASRGDRIGLIEPVIVQSGGPGGSGDLGGRSVEEPLPTLLSREHYGVATPVLVPYNGNSTPASVEQPLGTQPTHDRFGLVEPFIITTDRLLTNRSLPRPVSEPVPTVVASNDRIGLAEAFLVDCIGSKDAWPARARDIEEPVPTIMAGGERWAVAEPFLVPQFGEREGQAPRTHSVDAPLPAVTSHGAGALVEPRIIEEICPDDPERVHTDDGHCTPHLMHVTHGGRAHDVDAPLPTVTGANRGELALVQPVIDGKKLDIRFRMLQPHELARAMGFDDSYKFVGSRRDIVKQVGNAVAVNMAAALVSSVLAGAS